MVADSLWGIGWRGGAALGVVLVGYGTFFRLAGFHYASAWTGVFYVALPAGVFFAQRSLKRRNDGAMTFKAGIGLATLVLSIGSAAYCVFVYVYNRFIDDSLLRVIYDDRLSQLETRGLAAERFEAAKASLETSSQPGAFSLAVFVQLVIFGLLTALILTAFTRRSLPGKEVGS